MQDSEELWERLEGLIPDAERLPEGKEPREFFALEPGLATATEVAILLGHPLLLTGEAGSGKTRFAHALAQRLGLPLLRANVTSTTTRQDLLYELDQVARFYDNAADARRSPAAYLRLNGLGQAMLFAGGPDARWASFGDQAAQAFGAEKPTGTFADLYPRDRFPRAGPQRVVLLMDEFDKAPRDTSNDLLNELAGFTFTIRELGIEVAPAPTAPRPIVVMTSNQERGFSDALLRRCAYYDIPFPAGAEALRAIVLGHRKGFRERPQLLAGALALIGALRAPATGLAKVPGTAEILDWLHLVERGDGLGQKLGDPAQDEVTLTTLVKSKEDREAARKAIERWRSAG